jgi:nicotinamidase-related amidase
MTEDPMDEMSDEVEQAFERHATNPAVVTIDLHRGHLDPTVATLPLEAGRAAALLERTATLLDGYRTRGLSVIHMVTSYATREEILSNPYWAVQSGRGGVRAAIAEHNLEGGPGTELMPMIHSPSDVVLATKQRYDCFIGTDLEPTLRTAGHDSILLFGVNTNSCVIATTISASVRDFAVFVVEDGVDTMMGDFYHRAALQIIAGSFGWVIDGERSLRLLDARSAGDRAPR